MAVCNLFNKLNNTSGNFMMFSQYVEDITHNFTEGDNWKVVPTKFVALNIDYSKIDRFKVLPNDEELNVGIPKYFQNYFENACAYGREHFAEWAAVTGGVKAKSWNPDISRNLFWNAMFDGEFLHTSKYGETKLVDEVVYYGNINMHSYNEHQGMGYGEIYCYIPTDAEKAQCQVVCITDSDPEGRKCQVNELGTFLEGHNIAIDNYPKEYYYNRDFSMAFDDDNVGMLLNAQDTSFDINTIVVLYSVYVKINDRWNVVYANIPFGMYITGMFDNKGNLSNMVTKYVSTSYGTGTAYGLRICTRFTATPNGAILTNSDIVTDNSGYANVCQLMTAMNENLSRMLDVTKSAMNTSNQYKELLSIFKNNKTNVPYVKDINGTDYWFVNGKFVAAVGGGAASSGCTQLSPSTIEKRIENIMDGDESNDYSYIEDPNGCDCNPLSNWDLVDAINELDPDAELNPDDYPEFGGGTTGGGSGTGDEYEIAEDKDVADILNSYL